MTTSHSNVEQSASGVRVCVNNHPVAALGDGLVNGLRILIDCIYGNA